MSSDAELQLIYKVANAPVNNWPFPHFYVSDIFPADYYERLQAMLPTGPDAMKALPDVRPVSKDAYRERLVIGLSPEALQLLPEGQREFWSGMRSTLQGGAFARTMVEKFNLAISERFAGQRVRFYDETLLVQDTTNYALGPHSDSPRKVITLLFYLPRDDSQRHLGTSIYLPKDRKFRCMGGPHYPREAFDRVATMPFMPNSLFVFLKTNTSFHGVEPVTEADTRRWLLLYDIQHVVDQ